MRRLHCQLPANVMIKLYYYLVYSHLMLYWHGEDREVLMLLRMSVLTGEHVNYLFQFYTLSGRTGSALVWYSEGRTIASDSVHQVL